MLTISIYIRVVFPNGNDKQVRVFQKYEQLADDLSLGEIKALRASIVEEFEANNPTVVVSRDKCIIEI